MATQAFHIVSHYDPPNEDPAQDALSLPDDGWSTGHTFGLSKRILHPPKFVRPSGDYDEYGRPIAPEEDDEIQIIEHKPSNLGQWYGNLSRNRPTSEGLEARPPPRPSSAPTAEPSSSRPPDQPSSLNLPPFLKNLSLRLGEDSPISVPWASSSSIPEILARAPPPLPSEEPFVPPTFTVLGPANKGYSLLERHGWREGQTLGPSNRSSGSRAGIGFVPKQEVNEGEGSERAVMGDRDETYTSDVDVVDLTLDDDSDSGDERPASNASNPLRPPNLPSGRALLTPLPTVLRMDNAGIGSRRGTKRVITQSAQTLDILQRRKKKNRGRNADSIVHVGAKALISKAKKEKRERSALLAYLNEG